MLKKVFILASVVFLLLTGKNVFAQVNNYQEETLEARVVNVLEEKEIQFSDFDQEKQLYQKLEMLVTKGSLIDKRIIVENGSLPSANVVKYQKGDRLIVTHTKDFEGNDLFLISDYVRRGALVWLFFIFVFVVILIGKVWGITSILGMAFSFLVIFKFILPQIIKGANPIFVAIIGSLFIIPVTFYLSHGLNKKTSVAIIGTIISIVITGVLASFFVKVSKLTGFASEEAGFLQVSTEGQVNIKGLLLAGIIIGTLGVLDDVTVSQSAIVNRLKKVNKNLSFRELYGQAMKVGRDHISSMVNTLVLVYTGSVLPLLLLFIDSARSFSEVINYEIIAEEVVRTLVGSIGLVLAVPITTVVASVVFERDNLVVK